MDLEIPIHDITSEKSDISFKFFPLEQKSRYDTSIAHRHNYYEIFFFIKGGGIHTFDFETFPVESNSIHFVSPGQVHLLDRALKSYGYVILFSRDFYSFDLNNKDILLELPFLNNHSSKPILSLSESEIQVFLQIIKNIQDEYNSEDILRENILRSYLNIFLMKSKNFFQLKNAVFLEDNPSSQLVFQFKILLEKNYQKLHLVKEYAQLLSVTCDNLNKATKKSMGMNSSEVITNRIILEAKRLLMHSDMNNNEIAFYLNYDDPSYFSRFFKSKIGISPSDFRKKFV